ncbi:jg14949 [Pararge aegeria aegeria]|uniref:Jg14949 protein n=1 Tax=Pararge aegeria aegeria TaxID=348720 RepID=A0A8S4SKX5_9NEOP|nr:jg14949 [Pararge aegeria aegeria]
MIAILLVGLVACANAAPGWRDRHHSSLSPFDGSLDRYLNEQMFDTNRFWDEFNRDLNQEMMQLERTLADFSRHFPSMASTEGIVGNEYKIEIPLTGFEEKDIIVKARRGSLMIQAVHSDAGLNQNSYLDMRTLPMSVSEEGTWSYENGLLKISLPVDRSGESGTNLTPVTASPIPDRSREETESPTSGVQLDDIDLVRDSNKEKELKTNEIPNFEATTYAVDLKGDVEFVPVPYKK